MVLRFSDYRFWLLFGVLATAVLIACSGDTTSPPTNGDSGGGGAADVMTQG